MAWNTFRKDQFTFELGLVFHQRNSTIAKLKFLAKFQWNAAKTQNILKSFLCPCCICPCSCCQHLCCWEIIVFEDELLFNELQRKFSCCLLLVLFVCVVLFEFSWGFPRGGDGFELNPTAVEAHGGIQLQMVLLTAIAWSHLNVKCHNVSALVTTNCLVSIIHLWGLWGY